MSPAEREEVRNGGSAVAIDEEEVRQDVQQADVETQLEGTDSAVADEVK